MEFLQDVGSTLVQFVLPSLLTAIAGLIVKFLATQLKKQGVELTSAQEDRLRQLVRDAIAAVEERAMRAKKSEVARVDLTGEQKAEIATLYVQEKIPSLTKDQIRKAIDSELPWVRSSLPGGGLR